MLFANFVDLVHRFVPTRFLCNGNGNGHYSAYPQLPQTEPLDNGQFSQRPKKKTKNPGMVTKFDPYNPLMILNRGNRILIVFHLFCCSKHKLFTILTANVASLVRIIMHVNLLDSKNYLRFFWSILPLNCIPLWHTVTINLAQ